MHIEFERLHMGVPIYYGTCEGGPFNRRQMAHATTTYTVAIDRLSKKAAPAVIAGNDYDFGEYQWDGKAWIWQEPIRSEPKTAPTVHNR